MLTRENMKCQCGCGFRSMDYELKLIVDDMNVRFGDKSFKVTSGCRCAKHNAKVGGEPNSQHMQANAVDLAFEQVQAKEDSWHYLNFKYGSKFGIGIYDWGLHIDTRPTKSRWDRRTS